jgi:hypothetical protein
MKSSWWSSNYFDIIRMEREGAENAGVAGLMSGVQEMAIRRETKNFEKRGWRKKMKKSQSAHAPTRSGHATHKSWPLAKGLPPPVLVLAPRSIRKNAASN